MEGRREVRSEWVTAGRVGLVGVAGVGLPGVGGMEKEEEEGLVVTLTIPGSRRRSSWKCSREATRSLENSLALWVPAKMGAVKRGQRAEAACWRPGRVRAAARVRASCTAEVKRVQSSTVSWAVVLGRVAGGVSERMLTNSDFV